MSFIRSLMVAVCVLMGTAGQLPAGQLYFTELGGRVNTCTTEGQEVQNLVTGGDFFQLVAVDPAADQMFWTTVQGSGVSRAELDGSGVSRLVGLQWAGMAIEVHPGQQRVFFSDGRDRDTLTSYIYSMNYDGSDVQPLIQLDGDYTGGMAIAESTGHMYWAGIETSKIYRANLDGSDIIEILDTGTSPIAVELDLVGQKIYWTENGTGGVIRRANLDGTGIETLVTGLGNTLGLALDPFAEEMYWTDFHFGTITRAKFDGSGIETILTGLAEPQGLAIVVPEPASGILILGLSLLLMWHNGRRARC